MWCFFCCWVSNVLQCEQQSCRWHHLRVWEKSVSQFWRLWSNAVAFIYSLIRYMDAAGRTQRCKCVESTRTDGDFLSPLPSWVLTTFIVLFLQPELDCQSKLFFSSAAVFRCATEGGRCLECSPKKTCLLQIRAQIWNKTGSNVSSNSSFKPNICSSSLPLLMCGCSPPLSAGICTQVSLTGGNQSVIVLLQRSLEQFKAVR